VLNAAGLVLFLMADPPNVLTVTIVASVVLGGFGMGLGYPATNLLALEGVEPGLQGTVSGIQNTSLQAGGAIGTAVAAAALGAYGGQFTALAADDQIAARTSAAVILAALALFGWLALLSLHRPFQPTAGRCARSCTSR